MTPRRWAMVTILLVLALISATIYYFTIIQQPKWDEMKLIKQRLATEANVVEWDQLAKYVWDEVVWVAEGAVIDQEINTVILRDEQPPLIILQNELIDRTQIEAQFMQSYSNEDTVELLSSRLGFVAGQPVWEIYYKMDQQYNYHFYEATTGQTIDNYRLINKH
ncbi:hypothetical protein ACFSTH_04145 [Paenibacillus yanchengensis]|uniref:DUF5590 domain-containing protein n=1 Tax=Paenibacillus yanchengensis TaxID=2035833 RepID=A0ABW4YJM0_9BACL